MPALTRDSIVGADDVIRERIDIPQWGGHAWIHLMNGAARDEWDRANHEVQKRLGSTMPGIRARLAVLTLHDDEGVRVFPGKLEEEAEALGRKSGTILDRIWDKAARINGLTGEAQKEIEGNSASDQSDDSG